MIRIGALAVAAILVAGSAQAEVEPDLTLANRELVRFTNEFRRANSAADVTPNAQLQKAAQVFAVFIAGTDRFGHGADGATPAARAERAGYVGCAISENIGFQFHSLGFTSEELASELVEGWKTSPSHRRNMLDPAMTETGVAIARSPKTGRYYAVQMFGRPRSRSMSFEIANGSAVTIEYAVDGERHRVRPRQTAVHESCVAPTVAIAWPGSQAATTLKPDAGGRYSIVQSASGSFELRRE